jgi:site-specific DNA recombinase
MSPGGLPYGYAIVPTAAGARQIVEAEAVIVRRICEEYVAGSTPREIAARLNTDAIPSPSGGKWNGSTINGSAQRGVGILHNEIYGGRLTWNTNRMVRDPDTGKRLSRTNAESERTITDLPELAIVPSPLWDQVRERARARGGEKAWKLRRAHRPLSGLLKCGACGSGMSTMGSDKSGRTRIRCSGHKERGDCPDPATFYVDTVEQAVLDQLSAEMRHPDLLAEYVREYHAERQRLAATAISRRADLERRLAVAGSEADRITDWLVKGVGDVARLDRRAKELMEEEKSLHDQLAETESTPNVVALHPQALARFERQLTSLSEALGKAIDLDVQEAADAVRDLIDTVTLRRASNGGLTIDIEGRLNDLLIPSPTHLRVSGGSMVAKEGLEPPTPGL